VIKTLDAKWESQTELGSAEGDCLCKNGKNCQQKRPARLRRALLGGLAGSILSPILFRSGPLRAAIGDGVNASKMRAQAGDQLVFKTGARKGAVITMADVAIHARPLVTYPYDPIKGVLRNGSRLNQILLLRLPENSYTEEVRTRSVNGVVAYSAICTHQNCPVTAWHPDDQLFICPCHETHYDPKNGARVVSGPAKRALPALPLTVKDGVLMAARGLTGKVGRLKRA